MANVSKNNDYPVYIPDIITTPNEAFYKSLNDFFSYEIIDLLKDEKTVNYIKRIVEWKLCPNRNHRLWYSDCFNSSDNYQLTLIRICHICNQIFVVSGKFSTSYKFSKARNFLNNVINKPQSNRPLKMRLY